jgi:hypothetical protein
MAGRRAAAARGRRQRRLWRNRLLATLRSTYKPVCILCNRLKVLHKIKDPRFRGCHVRPAWRRTAAASPHVHAHAGFDEAAAAVSTQRRLSSAPRLRALDAGDGDGREAAALRGAQQQALPDAHRARHHRAGNHAADAGHLKALVHLRPL